MARKPDTPCSSCGKLLYISRSSLPPNRLTCQPCRRERKGADCGNPRHCYSHRECPQCRTSFCPTGPKQVTCSRSCGQIWRVSQTPKMSEAERAGRMRERWQAKNRRRRAAKRGQPSEPYTLSEIAERDRHRCQLCRRKVNMSLKAPHPKSPTIDHVIPIADGGDDTRANVQLAHFGCNSAKGARGSQQLALVG